jgi:hypothetical protein
MDPFYTLNIKIEEPARTLFLRLTITTHIRFLNLP